MGTKSKRKGKAGELECVALWKRLYPDARRGVMQMRDGTEVPDVDRCGEWWVESKRQRSPSPAAALAQAIEATDGRVPVACTRADRGEWLATLRLADFLDVLEEIESLKAEVRARSAAPEVA